MARNSTLWIDCICSLSYFSKNYGLQSEILVKIKELSVQHNIIEVYFECLVCLIEDKVIEKLDIDELGLLVEFLKIKEKEEKGKAYDQAGNVITNY